LQVDSQYHRELMSVIFTIFYAFIKVEYKQNSDIVFNDGFTYVLCCVLSN